MLKPLIDDVSYIGTTNNTITSVYNQLLECLDNTKPEKRDSFLNYIFTFILLHHKSCESKQFIWQVIKEEFLFEPTYEKLERCVGLLNCMIVEFHRRKWIQHVAWLREHLEVICDAYLGVYELEKMEQNGDI